MSAADPDPPTTEAATGAAASEATPDGWEPVLRVVPSWTEPTVSSASTLIGGPLGRHAVLGRARFWTPLRVVLLFAVLVLAAGWLGRAPCIQQTPDGAGGLTLDWQTNRQYVAMCYSDVVTWYGGERLDGPGLPYQTHWNAGEDAPDAGQTHYLDYPVVAGFFMWQTAQLTRHYQVLASNVGWLPTGLPEVVYFDITAAVLAAFWLVVVWVVAQARPSRPWDAALVALSPLALLHVFTGLDALPVAAATAGLYAFSRRRPGVAGLLLGLAAAAKLYAAFLLIPILLVSWARTPLRTSSSGESRILSRRVAGSSTPDRAEDPAGPVPAPDPAAPDPAEDQADPNRAEDPAGAPEVSRLVGAAALTWLLVNAPIAVLYTPGWLEFFRDGIRETPGPDSIYNALSYFTGWPDFPAGRTPWSLNWLVVGLLVAAVAGLAVLARLAPRPPRLSSLCFLLVAAVLLVGKTWSPQFSLWLVPLAVLALPRWRLLMAWMAADALVWVPRMYYYLGVDNKGLPPDLFLAVALIRDAVVVLVMVLVVRSVLRPATDPIRQLADDDPDWPSPARPRERPS